MLGAIGILVLASLPLVPGCGRTGLTGLSVWVDDEGREISVQVDGESWTGYWVESQTCPGGEARPRERFHLRVGSQGRGLGTIGICRWGFDECANGPVTVRFEAEVSVDRIEGTVFDPECGDYQGTEVLRRVRCGPSRHATDYLQSTSPLEWTEDSSGLEDSGRLVYRAARPARTPTPGGELQVWAVSPVRGEVSLEAPTGVRVRASDGELHYGFAPGGETLVALGEDVYPGTRLAVLAAPEVGSQTGFELTLLGFTPDLRPTDPNCIRGESGPLMIRREDDGSSSAEEER